MTEAIDFVKTDLMPDFDFDAFNHDNADYEGSNYVKKEDGPKEEAPAAEKEDEAPTGISAAATPEIDSDQEETPPPPASSHTDEEVDKW